MAIPARILRAEAESIAPAGTSRTTRDMLRHGRILAVGKTLLARHGRHAITFPSLAAALSITTAALRTHFPDLDALLADIIRSHLHALSGALSAIPLEGPGRPARLRAAYYAFARTPLGGLTEEHLLLTRDAHLLPDDERLPIEQTHQSLGDLLCQPCPKEALLLLDTAYLPLDRIEAMLAPLLAACTEPAPRPKKSAPPKPARPTPALPAGAARSHDRPGNWIFAAAAPDPAARAPPHPPPTLALSAILQGERAG